jgi:hypothetical protein
MTTLPKIHPTLSLHLTDPTGTPLLSSSSSQNAQSSNLQYRSLADLATTSLTAYNTSSRLGLGLPQRIMIETSKTGPIVLHSFLNPQVERRQLEVAGQGDGNTSGGAGAVLDQTREQLRPLSGSTVDNEDVNLSVSRSKYPRDGPDPDDGTTSPDSSVALANGQLLVNGVPMPLDKGKQVQEGDASTHSQTVADLPPATTSPSTAASTAVGYENAEAGEEVAAGEDTEKGAEEDEGQSPPLLIATVVAPVHDSEARRASVRLERLGREFQRKFKEQQAAEKEVVGEREDDTADG